MIVLIAGHRRKGQSAGFLGQGVVPFLKGLDRTLMSASVMHVNKIILESCFSKEICIGRAIRNTHTVPITSNYFLRKLTIIQGFHLPSSFLAQISKEKKKTPPFSKTIKKLCYT